MKALPYFILVFALFNETYTQEYIKEYSKDVNYTKNIDCKDFESLSLSSIIYFTSAKKYTHPVEVDLYLATKKHKEPVRINSSLVESLKDGEFDPLKKSIIIIHGYRSTATEKWVLDMKEKLLEAVSSTSKLINMCNVR